jgi:hypothetical protein
MVAVASQVCVGLDLPPADISIQVDLHWKPSTDKQIAGRVQRNDVSQKAPHTESVL